MKQEHSQAGAWEAEPQKFPNRSLGKRLSRATEIPKQELGN